MSPGNQQRWADISFDLVTKYEGIICTYRLTLAFDHKARFSKHVFYANSENPESIPPAGEPPVSGDGRARSPARSAAWRRPAEIAREVDQEIN